MLPPAKQRAPVPVEFVAFGVAAEVVVVVENKDLCHYQLVGKSKRTLKC